MSASPGHEILTGDPGTRACLLGNLAIVRGGLEAGVQFFSCYPGTPSSEIGDTFARIAKDAGVLFEYSINEKIAVEAAFAASLAGARAMCGMKHLGLNYAGDPISTMPYVGVNGGMVIVSAGDPSAITSPNEQDQRHFSRFLYLPVFDPATPEDALSMTRYAFGFSERTNLPVILRPTTRVCHSSGMVEFGPLPTERNQIRFEKDPPRYVPIPSNAQRMRLELTERFKRAEAELEQSGFFPRTGRGRSGILAGGVAYAHARQVVEELDLYERVTLQKIGAYPIPDKVLAEFLAGVDSVLVIEELTPFVEECVSLYAFRQHRQLPVFGKHSRHFPQEFEYSIELVDDAIRAYVRQERRPRAAATVPELPSRPPVLCAGCPHRASYYAIRKVFGADTIYCNDIGCYTLGYGEPLDACDVLLCMGSSISQASGLSRVTGRRTVACIGDSTFFHSGLPALTNAVQADDDVTVIILDNYVTAMTGFQPSPTSPPHNGDPRAPTEPKAPPEDTRGPAIEKAVRGLGVKRVFSVDPFNEEKTLAALKAAKDGSGVNVVVSHAPCAEVTRRRSKGKLNKPLAIDQQRCNQCGLCIRLLGCPAVYVADGEHVIDESLCNGCGLCARVCQRDAIQPVAAEGV
ncbi:MAG TPA: indolepyruvate ferredoxin oxidoreductase subunit alpha [Phycisphaerae bacterium]|nr:indolepyruvate ferredoxin oxidoreductase subunit alpha [Phycisphaerae bacterium]